MTTDLERYRLVDCTGLAGGATLGALQTGRFDLVRRVSSIKMGRENLRNNRSIFGWDWHDEYSEKPYDWEVEPNTHFVLGTPPCAGWSTMTRNEYRGASADVNKHQRMFVDYVGRAKPTVAAFESVQQIYTHADGRDYLRELRDKLEAESGLRYDLHHVLHNAIALGEAAQRRRYWAVFTQIPFGLDPPIPHRVPTLLECIGDLQGLAQTWQKQPYVRPETWWSSRRRSPNGVVDGHMGQRLTHYTRITEIIDAAGGVWLPGERLEDVVRRAYAAHGRLPDSWSTQEEKLKAKNFAMGMNQTGRWHGDRPARVLTGAALTQALHPTELRLLTLREAMRIQGWPDNLRLEHAQDVASSKLWAGKAAPVGAARWISHWVAKSLDGQPGSMRGLPDGDREYLHQSTANHKYHTPIDGRHVYTSRA